MALTAVEQSRSRGEGFADLDEVRLDARSRRWIAGEAVLARDAVGQQTCSRREARHSQFHPRTRAFGNLPGQQRFNPRRVQFLAGPGEIRQDFRRPAGRSFFGEDFGERTHASVSRVTDRAFQFGHKTA